MARIEYGGNIRRPARQETGLQQFPIILFWLLLWAFQPIINPYVTSAQPSPGIGHIPVARARVITVRDPRAVQTFAPQENRIEVMVNRGLIQLTHAESLKAAWHGLVSTEDVIGIKVYSSPGPTSGTRPAVVAGLLQSMLAAGLKQDRILIWDKHASDLRHSGFFELAERFGIQAAGAADQGYDESVFYETSLLGRPVWGDLEFGKSGPGIGRKSYVSKLLTQKVTKIINVTPLLNHNLAGVSGNLYGLAFGSVDNATRFESSADRIATAIPELIALPELGDRVALNIVDALICQYQGEERTLLHYSSMLGQLRMSRDPVALDVLSLAELKRQRQVAEIPEIPVNFQIYTNASLLEIGVSDMRKIDVTMVEPRDAAAPHGFINR